jgi:hypothetical protein
MSQIRNAVLIACSLAAVGGRAYAAEDHAVIQRLSSNGGLSSAAAKKLAQKVGQRMARAADAPPTVMDPLRAAISQAVLGTPVAPDQITAAKIRLKLYAGLNQFALEAIFAAHPGAIAGCVRDVGTTQAECEALVAAAGHTSVQQARATAGGPAGYAIGAAPMAQAPMAAPAQPSAAAGGSRFGSTYNSGYQAQAPAGYAARPAYGYQAPQQGYAAPGYGAAPGYAARPAYGYQAPQQGYAAPGYGAPPGYAAAPGYAPAPQYAAPQQNYARPAYAPAPAPAYRPQAAAPVAQQAPAPVYAAPVNQQDAASRRDAYKAQREAYLARQKAQFEERRAKSSTTLETNPDNAPPPAAVASRSAPAAAPAKASGKVAAPADSQMAAADTKRPVAAAAPEAAEPAAAPAAKTTEKPALDGDFLDGLLDDPLGGKKK